ncbi:NrtA/SsuA/CpmA family ABC transporter substrate-binding protein [Candidatus Uhrbacteria bacterium]|nr:NrtA/SsuA/CpmA family ABC transporter substrate-binding protein [Candidatus Uhrbacteria bacterium]
MKKVFIIPPILIAIIVSIAGVRIAQRQSGQPNSGKTRAQVELPTIIYAMPITVAAIPSYVALKKGFWEEEGLRVQPQMFSAGRLALDALLGGNAEVMSVSETPLVHAILQGNDIAIVATVTEHQETKIIARVDKGIIKPGDLIGKRIATLAGTNSDYFLTVFLKKYNIGLDQVRIVNMPPPDMVTALVKGDIDAYAAWEPHIYYAKKQLGDKATVFEPGELYNGRHTVAMNKKFVQKNPVIVQQLIKGLLRAEQFVKENPTESIKIVSDVTGVPTEAVELLWKEYVVDVQLDERFLEIINKEGQWAASLRKPAATLPNFRGYIFTQALKNERPSSVKGLGE